MLFGVYHIGGLDAYSVITCAYVQYNKHQQQFETRESSNCLSISLAPLRKKKRKRKEKSHDNHSFECYFLGIPSISSTVSKRARGGRKSPCEKSEYADIVADPLLLVLCYALGDPRDVADFLYRKLEAKTG